MVMAADDGLRQILDAWQLAALGGVGEVGRKLVQLGGGGGIAVRLRGLSRSSEVGGDLLGELLILAWIGLLELLQRTHDAGERRKLAIIPLERGGSQASALRIPGGVSQAGGLED